MSELDLRTVVYNPVPKVHSQAGISVLCQVDTILAPGMPVFFVKTGRIENGWISGRAPPQGLQFQESLVSQLWSHISLDSFKKFENPLHIWKIMQKTARLSHFCWKIQYSGRENGAVNAHWTM